MKKTLRVENGVVVGTASDKYESRNPIARYLVNGFDTTIAETAASCRPTRIVEIGCGEGHVTQLLLDNTQATLKCYDISDALLEDARAAVASDRAQFFNRSIYDMEAESSPPDLVVCCEVLEHLDDPLKGLDRLARLGAEHYLLSVPREPLWRILNFARGAYVKDFGNSPGHVQHWSKRGFARFVRQKFDVIKTRSPIPWTVLLCKRR